MNSTPHVVIVGGGFGGLEVAQRLRKAAVRVTLVDRHNYHLFQPLLYQVATGGLSPANIATPLRAIVRKQANCEVLMAEVTGFDVANQKVMLADGELNYDVLVVAAGATHSYFGRDDWEPLAPGLKTLADAAHIRRRIYLAFEAAEREPDTELRKALLTFIVVGGGPTGVPFYGSQPDAADVAKIKAPLLIQNAELDRRILAGAPAFEQALKDNSIPFESHVYPGVNHGFHNDTTPRHDAPAAKLAWDRTIVWFKKHLC